MSTPDLDEALSTLVRQDVTASGDKLDELKAERVLAMR